jgi:hypothetical protein
LNDKNSNRKGNTRSKRNKSTKRISWRNHARGGPVRAKFVLAPPRSLKSNDRYDAQLMIIVSDFSSVAPRTSIT